MDFTVEFYETETGIRPVHQFLDVLKASDPDDFAAVLAGLAKLRNRQYHREPLSKSLGDGLFELRHVGKLNTRVLWFFARGRRIVAVPSSASIRVVNIRKSVVFPAPSGPITPNNSPSPTLNEIFSNARTADFPVLKVFFTLLTLTAVII